MLYHATRVFLRRLRRVSGFAMTLLSVVWYNGTRTVTSWTKDVRIGNGMLKFARFLHNQTKFSQRKTEKKNEYNKHIITIVT